MEVVLRAVAVFGFLWILIRVLGKRELAEMSAFELVLLVTVGDIVQQGVTQEDMSLTGGLMAASTMGLLTVLLSYLSFRFKRVRPLLEGRAIVVFRDGAPDLGALRAERLTLDELKEAARTQGITNLGMVRVGILEPDGRFSFLRADDQPSQEAPEPHPGI